MNIKNYFLFCLLAMLAVTACKKSSTPKPGTTGNTGATGAQIDTDVYIVGSVTAANGKYVAAYSKNGVIKKLSDSTSDCYGSVIAVDGNDVYVCGYYNPDNSLATYWKNGVETKLANTAYSYSYVRGIAAYGGNAYMSGTVYGTSVSGNHAAYWNNGEFTNLAPNVSSDGYGIAVNEQGVYVVGDFYGTADTACYWKNGTLTPYPKDGSTFYNSNATAITLNGTNIYTVGHTKFTDKPHAKVSYWKNSDMAVYLTDGSTSARANAIAVSGNDVYIGGYTTASDGIHSVATYWKNGEIKTLTDGLSNAEVYNIAVAGNTVYAIGYVTASDGKEVTSYWKNGVIQPLSGFYAASIAVVTHPHVN